MMIKRALRTPFSLLIVAILLIAAIPVWYTYEATTNLAEAAPDEVVTFPDTNLEAAIREAIGKPEGDIYTSDLVGLTLLDASERNISDLTGLEHCINLWDLGINDNHISDISPLSNLTNLFSIWAPSNQISDVSPISNLTGLVYLNLENSPISDISPISNLTGLTYLNLENTQISDISTLTIVFAGMRSLSLANNSISDISTLTNLTSTTDLSLSNNQVSDISSLTNITSLEKLYLDNNQISDISPLSNLPQLTVVDLHSNQISDISPLVANEGLGNGDWIYLIGNQLSNFSLDSLIPQLEERGVDVIYDPNHTPTQPNNNFPSDGAADISLKPTIVSSAFSDPDGGDTHAASQWQISATSGDYSSPVFASGTDSSNLTQITIPDGSLSLITTYYWHVRYQDSNNAWSSWSTETSFTTTNDTTPPVVTLGTTSTSPTNTSPIPVTATFSEPVTSFTINDIKVGNGTADNFNAISTTVYTFDVTPGADGEVTVNIAADAAQDAAGNSNTAATELGITYDSTAPTVTISSTSTSPTNTSPIPVTATFSEAVSRFTVDAITIGNGTVSNFIAVSTTVYTFDVTPSADGEVFVNIADSAAKDAAGNSNTAAAEFSIQYNEIEGEAGGCCSSSSMNVSESELAIGWGIIGLCWGGGYYMVRRSKRFKI